MIAVASRRLVTAMLVAFTVCGCVRVGVTVTNAPSISDCIQGSATKPCP